MNWQKKHLKAGISQKIPIKVSYLNLTIYSG